MPTTHRAGSSNSATRIPKPTEAHAGLSWVSCRETRNTLETCQTRCEARTEDVAHSTPSRTRLAPNSDKTFSGIYSISALGSMPKLLACRARRTIDAERTILGAAPAPFHRTTHTIAYTSRHSERPNIQTSVRHEKKPPVTLPDELHLLSDLHVLNLFVNLKVRKSNLVIHAQSLPLLLLRVRIRPGTQPPSSSAEAPSSPGANPREEQR